MIKIKIKIQASRNTYELDNNKMTMGVQTS